MTEDKPHGRPRSSRIDDAVLEATWTLLSEGGFRDLSLEAVARRAGTTRAAIYRRWPGRAHLALATLARRLSLPAIPDTGCPLCDLGEAMELFLTAIQTIRPDVLSMVYAEATSDPGLYETFVKVVLDPPRAAVTAVLERARDHGDLRQDVDIPALLDTLNAIVYYRAIFAKQHLTHDELASVVELLLRGAAADYQALLERSQALDMNHTLPV